MKKSSKILASLISVFTVVTLGCNLILKAEYDKIDFNDPYYGYDTETVNPFKCVVLTGTGLGLTQILPGGSFQIRTTLSKQAFNWQIVGDTLKVNFGMNLNENNWAPGEPFEAKPVAFISAPSLSGVFSSGINCRISDWKSQRFVLRQEKSRVLLVNNSIQNLSAQVNRRSSIKIDQQNSLDTVAINLNDGSWLTASDNKFKLFELKADESAHLELPMSLINKISRK